MAALKCSFLRAQHSDTSALQQHPAAPATTPRRKAQTALQHKHLATASCSGTSNQAPKRKHATLLIQDIEVRTPLASLSGKKHVCVCVDLGDSFMYFGNQIPEHVLSTQRRSGQRENEKDVLNVHAGITLSGRLCACVCMCMCVCVRMCVPACVLPCAYVAHSATSWPLLHQVSPNNGYCMIQ